MFQYKIKTSLLFFFSLILILGCSTEKRLPPLPWDSLNNTHLNPVFKKGEFVKSIYDITTGKKFDIPLFEDLPTDNIANFKCYHIGVNYFWLSQNKLHITEQNSVNCGFFACGILDLKTGQFTKPESCVDGSLTSYIEPMGNDLYLHFECPEGPCVGSVIRWTPNPSTTLENRETEIKYLTDAWAETVGDTYYLSSSCNPKTGDYAETPPSDCLSGCEHCYGYGNGPKFLWKWKVGKDPQRVQ